MSKERLSVGKDILVYLPSQLVLGVMGFIMIRLQTQYFSTAEKGYFDIVSISIRMGVLIVGGWIFQSFLRFYEQYQIEDKEKSFYSTIFTVYLMINLLGGGILFLSRFLFQDPGYRMLLLWGILVFVGLSSTSLIYNFLRVKQEKIWYAIVNSVGAVAKVILLSLFVTRLHLSVESIFLSMGLVDLTVSVIVFLRFNMGKYISLSMEYISVQDIKKFFVYGFPLMGVVIFSGLLNYLDRYCIRIFWGEAEVGLYGSGYQIVSSSLYIFSTLIMTGTYPIILKVWNKEGRKATEVKLGQAVRYYLFLAIPAVVGLSTLAIWIFQTIIERPEYFPAYRVVPWVAVGYVCLGLTDFSNKIFELLKKTKMILYFNGVAAMVNLLLNITLIPIYGYEIAAVTTFFSYFVYFCLSIWYSRKEFTFVISPNSVIKILIASGAMYIGLKAGMKILEPNFLHLFVLILCGGGIYGIILLVSGELREEIKGIMTMLHKS